MHLPRLDPGGGGGGVSGPASARILVVEDNDTLRRGIARALRESWSDVAEVVSGDAAVAAISDPAGEAYDVVVTDVRLPGADGLAVLRAARARDSRTSVLLMTAYGSIETAVEAMREGAFDFVQKPLDLDQIELRVARAVDHRRLLAEVSELRAERDVRHAADEVVGASPALRAAVDLARRVAPTRSTVLVTGETGTGKEVIAGLVHRISPRRDGPLVKVNCAALPETLLESELFGHERGAFTGADRPRVGRFEQANGGTLFLDEVGDMTPTTQAKLLRVLQDQEFHRLGGTRILRTDARIVTATNRELPKLIREGLFREDLYFRLNVIRIHLPPLRERQEDLLALAHRFLRELAAEANRPVRGFSRAALERLRSHSWPGNVRELRNALERAVLMAEGARISVEDLALAGEPPDGEGRGWQPELPPEGLDLRDVERSLVLSALDRTGYVQKDAARLLRVSRRKLNYMIRRMGITHPSWRRNRSRGGRTGHRGGAGPAEPLDSSPARTREGREWGTPTGVTGSNRRPSHPERCLHANPRASTARPGRAARRGCVPGRRRQARRTHESRPGICRRGALCRGDHRVQERTPAGSEQRGRALPALPRLPPVAEDQGGLLGAAGDGAPRSVEPLREARVLAARDPGR
jgi:DNA-binding NtrC family response regulator